MAVTYCTRDVLHALWGTGVAQSPHLNAWNSRKPGTITA
jgi:hypothetical protein